MAKIYPTPRSGHVYGNRVNPIEAITTHSEPLDALERDYIVERRFNTDRRQHRGDRGPFDMRGGRDRRKNRPGHPSIDLNA